MKVTQHNTLWSVLAGLLLNFSRYCFSEAGLYSEVCLLCLLVSIPKNTEVFGKLPKTLGTCNICCLIMRSFSHSQIWWNLANRLKNHSTQKKHNLIKHNFFRNQAKAVLKDHKKQNACMRKCRNMLRIQIFFSIFFFPQRTKTFPWDKSGDCLLTDLLYTSLVFIFYFDTCEFAVQAMTVGNKMILLFFFSLILFNLNCVDTKEFEGREFGQIYLCLDNLSLS